MFKPFDFAKLDTVTEAPLKMQKQASRSLAQSQDSLKSLPDLLLSSDCYQEWNGQVMQLFQAR